MSLSDHGISLACEDTKCSVKIQCWKFDSEDAFKSYLTGRVKSRLSDEEGTAELTAHYDSIATTGFQESKLRKIFSQDLPSESWKIGEVLAECFLEDADNVRFPWNGCRDQKVGNASLPGADLVGFKGEGANTRFLFGEVKTSEDTAHPPNAMYGRSGMTQQIENLKSCANARRLLVKWFAIRAKSASWEADYRAALTAYISSDEKVHLQGVLVRDCDPDIKDMASRGHALGRGQPPDMVLSLYAVYCVCSISNFPDFIREESAS